MFRIVPEKARTLTLWRRQELRERDKEVKTMLGGQVGGVAEKEPAISGKREQREGERCTPASRFLVSSFGCMDSYWPEAAGNFGPMWCNL